MKFREIFRFEFAYQVRRPWPWLFAAVLVVFNFLMTRDGSLQEVLYTDFYINSPFAIIKTTVFGSLIWLVMAAAIAGDAAARDVATGMHALLYTAPIKKTEYLGGRFLAVLLLNALILLAVQAGIILGVYLPGVHPEAIGPFRLMAYFTAYAFISLPNAFAVTAIQFFLAAMSGRAMASYFGSFLTVFMGFFVASFLLFKQGLGTLLDPIGIRFIVEDVAHLWTTIEKNHRLLALEGTVLQNRLLWLSLGLVALAITYLNFKFNHRSGSTWWSWFRSPSRNVHSPAPAGLARTASTRIQIPEVSRTFGFATQARQTITIAWTSFCSVAVSWGGIALLVVLPILAIPVVLDQMETRGVPLVPKTRLVVNELTGSLSDELNRWVIIPFLIVFFTGELVWREREARMGEITDTMPGSEWAPFLGKFLGLALVLISFLCLQTMAGIISQVIMGYHNFEIGLYLKIMFGLQLTDYLLFTLLALVVHVVVNQKYMGYLLATIAFVFISMASLFGIEHNLLIYGSSPGWSYTDMRGFGPTLGPWFYYKFYWVAWALLLAVVARLLWVRGKESSLRVRLQLSRQRLKSITAWTAAVVAGLVLGLGGFIFYNTNVLNQYLTADEKKERAFAYERRYGQYAKIPQPDLFAIKLHVEIYPERREVEISGSYRLVNRSAIAIDSIHLTTVPGVETKAVTFNQAAAQVLSDEKLHYRIYALKKPLKPGDSVQLNFKVLIKPHGFRENGADLTVVENGTYFNNEQLPSIGYQKSRELINAGDRREFKLSPRPIIASLYNVAARQTQGGGSSTFDAVIGTIKDQVAVAPGALRRTWTENGRCYFHYVTSNPIGGEWGIYSAKYAVHKFKWQSSAADNVKPVQVRIYHQPEQKAHLYRMVKSIRASLEYYSRAFGPYRFSHLTFVERAGNGTGLHADASMISYTEGFPLWQPGKEAGRPDIPFAVVAHEMAHQWTVPYANVEGAPVMSESLAWYYAIKVVEKTYGAEHFRQLLNWMHEPYRREIRRGEPLLRGLDPYMSYRKGPFALYTLSEYLGEAQVNKALRQLRVKHSTPKAPLATTLDLYRALQAVSPDSLQYLLHDLFKVNTNWELKTELATAQKTAAGTWQVKLQVQARKLAFDEAGRETEVPLDDWIEIGVFAPPKNGKPQQILYLQKHRVRAGEHTINITVPQKPFRAGIDPHNLLIDQKTDDNIKDIKL